MRADQARASQWMALSSSVDSGAVGGVSSAPVPPMPTPIPHATYRPSPKAPQTTAGIELGSPTATVVADVTGDEGLEALACSANRYVICADADGEVLWRRNVGGAATQMVVADVTGDGRPEILVCVQDASPVVLSGDGEVLARIPTMAFPSHIAVADVTGDGAPALLTASDGVVEAVGVE